MNRLLKIKDAEVTIAREGQSHTVKIPDLEVSAGSTTILLGPSGSGKSVLLKTLSGVFPSGTTQSFGEFEVCGQSLKALSPRIAESKGDPLNKLFYIFQDPRTYLHSRLSIRQYGALLAKKDRHRVDVEEVFSKLIRDAGLEHRIDTASNHLSGGEAQRLMLVMMQVLKPKLVLADEPLSAQDRLHHENLRTQLNRYIGNADEERGLLLVTHEIRDLEQSFRDGLAPRFYVLEQEAPGQFCVSPEIDASEISAALSGVSDKAAEDLSIENANIPDTVRQFFLSARELASHRRDQQYNQSQAQAPLLGVSELSFSWWRGRTEAPLFEALSFVSHKGENLGIMGLSGVGKSTLAEVLLRLVQGHKGEILWFGSRDLKDGDFRNRVQYVFQDCERAMAWETGTLETAVLRAIGRKASELDTHESGQLDEILKTLGLDRLKDKEVLELSGGQLRRAYIARALFKLLFDQRKDEPIVLVLDEATVGLDLVAQHRLLSLLDSYCSDTSKQLTLVVISHDPVVVRYLSDQLVIMQKEDSSQSGASIVETLCGEEIAQGPYLHDHTRDLMSTQYLSRQALR